MEFISKPKICVYPDATVAFQGKPKIRVEGGYMGGFECPTIVRYRKAEARGMLCVRTKDSYCGQITSVFKDTLGVSWTNLDAVQRPRS